MSGNFPLKKNHFSGASRLTERRSVGLVSLLNELAQFPTLELGSARTSDFTAVGDTLHRVNPTGGAVVVTLPAITDNLGKTVIVKNQSDSSNQISLLPDGSDTIEGLASLAFTITRASIVLRNDAVGDWMII